MSDENLIKLIDIAVVRKRDEDWNEAIQAAARIAETLVMDRNIIAGNVTRIHRGATGQEIADEIRRQLLRKTEP